MTNLQPPALPDLLLDARSDPSVYRGFRTGELLRVALGIYAPIQEWNALPAWTRHGLAAQAAGLSRPELVLCAETAAALHGVPLAATPDRVHIVAEHPSLRGRRPPVHAVPRQVREVRPVPPRFGVWAHTGVDPEWVAGVHVAPLALAGAQAMARATFPRALAVADALAREPAAGPSASTVLDVIAERGRSWHSARGAARIARAVAHANPSAESVGESISRALMAMAGLEPPVLQHVFVDSSGFIARVDFWWPRWGIVGEFDGKGKILDAGGGNRSQQWAAVDRERQRHFRLAAHPEVRAVVRWQWSDLQSPRGLPELLTRAGVGRAGSIAA